MQLPLYKTFTEEQLKQFGPPKQAAEFRTVRRVYETPFVYDNVQVCVFTEIDPTKGIELIADQGYIMITEEQPIVAVTVVGSGCARYGYNMVEWWEDGEGIDEMQDQLVKRQRVENLNGMHPQVYTEIMRNAPWTRGLYQGKPINQPNISGGTYQDDVAMIKYHSKNFYEPFDISLYENTAHFRVGTKDKYPHRILVRSGCKDVEEPGTPCDRYPAEYAVRLIELTVLEAADKQD
jgi:hypothetical protein